MKKITGALLMLLALVMVTPSMADSNEYSLTIKDHKFDPSVIEIPAGQKVRLLIKNEDATPEEFESYDLNREKIISGNSQSIVFVGPLEAGEYSFFGEFNKDTAQGRLIAN